MNKEFNINLSTIIELIDEILDNKTLYLNTKDINFKDLENKYKFIDSFIEVVSNYNHISISCDINNQSYRKSLEQFSIILKDIIIKYTKAKKIIDASTYMENDKISLVGMIDILLDLNIKKDYIDTLSEKLKNSDFNIGDYSWINNFVNNIKDTKMITSYIKYKKFNISSKFKNLKETISYTEITNAQYKLECLLNNKYALMPPIYINDFTKYFISANFPLTINENELLNYISNLKIDYDKKPKKLKWYYYLNPKKYIEVKQYNEYITNEYNNIKITMFNQYKENIDSLDLYIKSFDFLKNIINENYFNKIYDYIYDENEMYTFLNNIFNTISLYKEVLSIQEEISKFKLKERRLLELCYEKDDTVSRYKEKLFVLQNIIILLSYKILKDNNSDIDMKRDLLDILIVQLNTDIDILSKLICTNNYISKFNITFYDVIPKIEENNSSINCEFKTVEWDDIARYIDELAEYNLKANEKFKTTSNMFKFLKEKIESLGYKVVQNYTFNSINLDIAVVNPNRPNRFIYLFSDSLISNSYDTIKKLSVIKRANIPIIYCWSDDFYVNKNIATVNLIKKLKNLLG